MGFEEVRLDKMSYFKINDSLGFYLKEDYVKDWVDNSMLFVEVDDVEACRIELISKKLQDKYKLVRFSKIKTFEYGRELFMYKPPGVL